MMMTRIFSDTVYFFTRMNFAFMIMIIGRVDQAIKEGRLSVRVNGKSVVLMQLRNCVSLF